MHRCSIPPKGINLFLDFMTEDAKWRVYCGCGEAATPEADTVGVGAIVDEFLNLFGTTRLQ
jgi:hypothetical protein